MKLADVTILIKTFERPNCLAALLRSYRRMGWQCPVVIADDSKAPYEARMKAEFGDLITNYICLPFDVGLSAGRNVLLDYVETPYFVLCDDDFIFDRRSDLALMRHILATTNLELLGGVIFNRELRIQGVSIWRLLGRGKLFTVLRILSKQETLVRFQGTYEVTHHTLTTKAISYHPPFTRCDYVLNFFMAKIAAFHTRHIRWNEALKVGEHTPFFMEAKQKGLQVATTEEVGVIHQPVISTHYLSYRNRAKQYRNTVLHEQGIIYFDDTPTVTPG